MESAGNSNSGVEFKFWRGNVTKRHYLHKSDALSVRILASSNANSGVERYRFWRGAVQFWRAAIQILVWSVPCDNLLARTKILAWGVGVEADILPWGPRRQSLTWSFGVEMQNFRGMLQHGWLWRGIAILAWN